MKNPRVATGFMPYAETKLLQKANQIALGLTGNPNFPNSIPDLLVLGAAINAYAAILANPTSKLNTAAKKDARNNLVAVLNQLALYVQMNSGNDVIVMLSSGFSLTKTPVGVLPKPENFKVKPLYNGSVKMPLKKIEGADSYCFEYTQAPITANSIWVSVMSTKTSTIVSNLGSGSYYAFRVTGIGSNPAFVYSDVVVSYVL